MRNSTGIRGNTAVAEARSVPQHRHGVVLRTDGTYQHSRCGRTARYVGHGTAQDDWASLFRCDHCHETIPHHGLVLV